MSVVVSVEDVGPWRKQLTVEVPAADIEAETQRVVREYGNQVRLPGFRKGKVPASLVRKRFAEDIDREVIERLLPVYWQKAREEHDIDPLLPPEVDETWALFQALFEHGGDAARAWEGTLTAMLQDVRVASY